MSNIIYKATGVVIDEEGRLLLSKEEGAKYWSFPGGGRDEGENDIECLKREFMEEMGIEIFEEDIEFYTEAPEFPAANDPGKILKAYLYKVKIGSTPKSMSEIEIIKWFSKEELLSDEFTESFSKFTKEFAIPKLIEDGIVK